MNNDTKSMIAFRSSRKGYDKNDVNRYIEEMSIRFTSKEASLKSKISELEGKLASVTPDEGSKTELSALMATVDELEAKNNDLKAEIERLTLALSAAEIKKAEEPRTEACPEYKEMSEKLGSIMLKANLDAERIVSEAEAEASKQLSEAEKNADGIRLDAAVSARLMTAKVKEKLGAMTEEYIAGLRAVSEESALEYRRLYEELKEEVSRLGVNKDEIKSSLYRD